MGGFFADALGAVARVFTAIADIFVGEPSHPAPGPRDPLDLKITFVSSAEPSRGDTVEVRWECTPPESLAFQVIQLHALAFDGRFATQTFGCLPSALLHGGEDQHGCTPLDLGQRAFQFVFNRPVTFQLIAGDGGSRILQKFIKFGLPNVELRLKIPLDHGDYPRLAGQATGDGMSISFENAFGIYKLAPGGGSTGGDGVIEYLGGDEFTSNFAPGSPFFVTSETFRESEHFRSAVGGAFPQLLADFLVTPAGRPLDGVEEFADAVIVGVGLALDGSVETLPTSKGDCDVVTSTIFKDLEPIFVQIDTWSGESTPTGPVVSNIHVGNIPQGFVMACFHGDLSWQATLRTGTCDVTIEAPQHSSTRFSHGSIKDARVGQELVRVGSLEVLTPWLPIIELAWSGVSVYPDTDLGPLLASQYNLP